MHDWKSIDHLNKYNEMHMKNRKAREITWAMILSIFTAAIVVGIAAKKHGQLLSTRSPAPAIEAVEQKAQTAKPKNARAKKSKLASMPASDISKLLEAKDDDSVIELIEDAQVDDDWKTIKKIVDAMLAMDKWQDKVSEDVQDAMVDALSDFMPHSFPEMLSFLGSPYEDIREDVLDEAKQAIDECDDEAMVSKLIVSFSSIVEDKGFIESMIMEIDTLEPKHAASAMIGILKNGNEAFKSALANEIEELTDQAELTEEAILKWLEEEEKE